MARLYRHAQSQQQQQDLGYANHGHELRHHASHPQMGGSSGGGGGAGTRPLHPYYQVHPQANSNAQAASNTGMVLPPLTAPSSFPSLGSSGGGGGGDLPQLAAHVSLGRNQLPPDSTLLTPLPGYEPDPELQRAMEGRYAQGQEEEEGYGSPGERYL